MKQLVQIYFPLNRQRAALYLRLDVIRHINYLASIISVQFTVRRARNQNDWLRDVCVKVEAFAHDSPAGEGVVVDDYIESAL